MSMTYAGIRALTTTPRQFPLPTTGAVAVDTGAATDTTATTDTQTEEDTVGNLSPTMDTSPMVLLEHFAWLLVYLRLCLLNY